MEKVVEKIRNGEGLNPEDALQMLKVDISSEYYHQILSFADQYARKVFANKGTLFTQVGLDYQACSVNCKFCSLAKDAFDEVGAIEKTMEEITSAVETALANNTDEIFLMTTAEYNKLKFLEVVQAARALMPRDMRLVVNIGDFDLKYAQELKKAGVTGAYHICRLGEGIDTDVSVENRMHTLDAIRDAGLELYYCVEPIGPEHSDEQIVDEIFRTKDYNVGVMAVMKRVAVPGSQLYELGEIPSHRLALICAVTCLCARPKRAMGVHEPDLLCLISGANQLYAEIGINPRDKVMNTEESRGATSERARQLFFQTGWC